MSDKRNLIVVLSALLIVGFLATTLASYFVSSGSLRQNIVTNELPLTSDNIYSEVQKDLVTPILISSMMASDTFVRDWVLAGEEDVAQISRFLTEIKERYNAVTSFFVSERTRTYYHAGGVLKTVQESEPRDIWYFRVRRMTEPYEINVDPDLANQDTLTIFINYRVLGYDGSLLGVTGVGLTVSAVRNLIRDYQRRFGRTVYFVSSHGAVLLVSDSDQVPEPSIARRQGMERIAAGLGRGSEGAHEYMRQGQTHLLNIRFIPELNWYLFVEKRVDEALVDLRRTLYLNLAICALITVLVLLATRFTINRYQSRLESLAATDKLTGLASRHASDILLPQALVDARRMAEPMAIMLLDIDGFKQVNDRHGHLIGDAVLCAVAEAAREAVRGADIICRWGGDEYLIVLRNCTLANALVIAERIRSNVESGRGAGEASLPAATVSLGVAALGAGENEADLLARADRALYQAKNAGRNRVILAEG